MGISTDWLTVVSIEHNQLKVLVWSLLSAIEALPPIYVNSLTN